MNNPICYSVQLEFGLNICKKKLAPNYFLKKFVYMCYPNAVYQISISYYAWNMSKSLCAGVVVGVVGGCGGANL